MTGDPIMRDRYAIEQDIAQVEMKIAQLCGSLRSGETAEQQDDVPGRLIEAANDLMRLSGELAEVWHKPQVAT